MIKHKQGVVAMMNKSKIRFLFAFVLIVSISSVSLYSQGIGGWYSAAVKFDLPKDFTFDVNLEARTSYNYIFSLDQYFPEFDLGYKINKRLDVSASYRFSQTKEDNSCFYTRNKYYFNVSFDIPVQNFSLKNRARIQLQSRQYIEDEENKILSKYFRDKIELNYDLNNTPIDPFISIEVFYPLNKFEINTVDEFRLAGGIDFPLNKKQDMSVGLMFNKERFPRPESAIILLVGYKFSVN
jgi:hypothetical protein